MGNQSEKFVGCQKHGTKNYLSYLQNNMNNLILLFIRKLAAAGSSARVSNENYRTG